VTHPDRSRRSFLKKSATAVSGSWIALSMPAILATCQQASEASQNDEPFVALGPEEAAELEAMAARIIPTTDTPGATEAGVIHFMDKVLAGEQSDALAPMRAGLAELRASASTAFSATSFAALSADQQDELLADIEDSEFFLTVRYLTLAGMFSLPEHGGNRDQIGWQLLGFRDQHAWLPPFGSYDADYAERGE